MTLTSARHDWEEGQRRIEGLGVEADRKSVV